MGFFNLELKQRMEWAQQDFERKHEAIFQLKDPNIPEEVKTLNPVQRRALETFQQQAIQRVGQARQQAIKAQQLAVEFHSTSGPLLYRRPRSKRAYAEWQSRIESLDGLKLVFSMIMGPYQ
jgi:hypothetical protein